MGAFLRISVRDLALGAEGAPAASLFTSREVPALPLTPESLLYYGLPRPSRVTDAKV
jgi:hypothetical protein